MLASRRDPLKFSPVLTCGHCDFLTFWRRRWITGSEITSIHNYPQRRK
uniref:Uncharacterized protein n=1 Tax=Klebsiella pneumoniae subsp. pneumoniae TaxID=72407 RepID=A0A7T7GQM8_KLEPN|nr:hypothetical protein [Klebsiella pneumoniae subsp. pneumoniae]